MMQAVFAQPGLRLPQLRPDQFEIADSKTKIKVVACGRRWGKSLTARFMGFIQALAGGRVAWVVPTYKNARSTWREAEAVAKELADYGVVINKTEKIIEFPNGGFLGIYSADNIDALRGDSFHLVVLDEAAFMPEEAFYEVCLPLVGETGGTIMAIGTPHGRNWFYKLYLDGLENRDPDVQSWHAPTTANPHPEIARFVRIAKRHMPEEAFKQEILAEFIDGAGVVFKNVRDVCVGGIFDVPKLGHRYVCGVDLAKKKDFTVFNVFDVTENKQVFFQRYHRVDYTDQAKKLAELHKRWRFSSIVVEGNNVGEAFLDICKPYRLPIEVIITKRQNKIDMIEAVVVAFEQKTVTLINDRDQIDEFTSYESKLSNTGLLKYGAPEHRHDDFVMSFALAYTKAQGRRKSGISFWNGRIPGGRSA